jgi:hypothetical protein
MTESWDAMHGFCLGIRACANAMHSIVEGESEMHCACLCVRWTCRRGSWIVDGNVMPIKMELIVVFSKFCSWPGTACARCVRGRSPPRLGTRNCIRRFALVLYSCVSFACLDSTTSRLMLSVFPPLTVAWDVHVFYNLDCYTDTVSWASQQQVAWWDGLEAVVCIVPRIQRDRDTFQCFSI